MPGRPLLLPVGLISAFVPIDRFFIRSGCDEKWWTAEGYFQTGSERLDRVYGWMEGIRRHAPQQEIPIIVNVCRNILGAPSTDYQIQRQLQIIIEQLDEGDPRIPSLDALHLDHRVLDAVGSLIANAHYSRAVQNAFVAPVNAVKIKAGRSDLDGRDLMLHVFSA